MVQCDVCGVAGQVKQRAHTCAATIYQRVGREVHAADPLGEDDVVHPLSAVGCDAVVAEQAGGTDVLRPHPCLDAEKVRPLFAQ